MYYCKWFKDIFIIYISIILYVAYGIISRQFVRSSFFFLYVCLSRFFFEVFRQGFEPCYLVVLCMHSPVGNFSYRWLLSCRIYNLKSCQKVLQLWGIEPKEPGHFFFLFKFVSWRTNIYLSAVWQLLLIYGDIACFGWRAGIFF